MEQSRCHSDEIVDFACSIERQGLDAANSCGVTITDCLNTFHRITNSHRMIFNTFPYIILD